MSQWDILVDGGNGLAERSNQSILQRLRTHGIFGNNEWDVDLLFAEIQFNNLTSSSLRLSPFEIHEGRTPHFTLDFPRTSPLSASNVIFLCETALNNHTICVRLSKSNLSLGMTVMEFGLHAHVGSLGMAESPSDVVIQPTLEIGAFCTG